VYLFAFFSVKLRANFIKKLKMKKLLFVLTLGLAVVVSSCNKDQASVKKLEGSWTATKFTTTDGGVTYDFLADGGAASMTFEKCKLKTDEWCGCTSTSSWGGFSFTDTDMVYRVTGDGTKLETKDHADSTEIWSQTIVELTKDKVVLQDVDGTTTTDMEMSKN
jgi:hypothetical protein